jgi:LPXTG-site transpeptidase (sortase) family protein
LLTINYIKKGFIFDEISMNYMLSGRIIRLLKLFTIIISLGVISGVTLFILIDNNLIGINIIPEVESSVEFRLLIPKINLEKEVISNVDPRDDNIYKEAFRKGIAHGLGTKFPDEIGNTYLYAHSTRDVKDIERNAGWFTRLDELSVGDEFTIIYGHKIYIYSIASIDIVDPRATGVYTAYAPIQMVTMQTCHPRGEIEERLILKAVLLKTEDIANNS